MTTITIDIETDYSHDPAVVERLTSRITPPANYKSEEAIEKWWNGAGADKKVEAQRKTALDPLWGSIKMIGYQIDDGEPKIIAGVEGMVLEMLFSQLNAIFKADNAPPLIVGHNVKNFDLDYVRKRAIVQGVKMPKWMGVYYTRYSTDVFDTMENWAGWGKHVKLDDLAYALLGESKTSDGAASLDMTEDECAEYCKSDVAITYKIYRKLTGE